MVNYYFKKEFERALEYMKKPQRLGPLLTAKHVIMFSALRKQAKYGQFRGEVPTKLKPEELSVVTAWKNLGDMPQERAMRIYVKELTKLNPKWELVVPKL
eukprot:TRINITY_DN15306_c0_g1_i2.p1 TRINITY_DN15306_c0_g1~~TRINITY_DN15306_c0_g1_i2.p1  ORF type:complete len:100 (-),score=33.15 TRINITY_DN15306_c0_g1_i2:132-431(-)